MNMKIGIDIDDTLTNTRECQIDCWREFVLNNKTDKYTTSIPENINRFGDDYIDLFWDTYRETLFAPGFKEDASLITNRLKNEGNIIYIITSRPESKYDGLVNKLEKVFNEGNIAYNYIITDIKEKGKYIKDNNLDILIDDDILHIKDTIKEGKIGILFNKKNPDVPYSSSTWKEVYDIINSIKDGTL